MLLSLFFTTVSKSKNIPDPPVIGSYSDSVLITLVSFTPIYRKIMVFPSTVAIGQAFVSGSDDVLICMDFILLSFVFIALLRSIPIDLPSSGDGGVIFKTCT